MRRGTTWTHGYTNVPYTKDEIKELYSTYSQNGKVVLEKRLTDAEFDGNTIAFHLSVDETLLFEESDFIYYQLTIDGNDGETVKSKTFRTIAERSVRDA